MRDTVTLTLSDEGLATAPASYSYTLMNFGSWWQQFVT